MQSLNELPLRTTVPTLSVATLSGFTGIALVLLAIAAAEPLLFGSGYYATLSFHPFWIVILMAPLLQGVAGGVVAVVLASLLLGLPDRMLGEDAIVYLARSVDTPLRWLVVALLIGLVRHIQADENNRLRVDLQKAENNCNQLASEIERMDMLLADLERAAAVRPAVHNLAPSLVRIADKSCTGTDCAKIGAVLALAGAQEAQIGPAFDAAAKVLVDGPTCLLLTSAADAPIVLSRASLPVGVKTGDLAKARPSTRRLGHLPVSICASKDEPEIFLVVIGPEGAAHGDLKLLAKAARIAFDRLSAQLTGHPNHDDANH